MKKNRILSTMALAVTLAVSVTACGSKSSTEPSPSTSSEASAKPTGLKGEISFLDVMSTDEHTAALKSIIAKYEKANPGVKVNYSTVPWDQAYSKVMAMAASKSLPDINTGSYTELAASGAVIPLDKYWDKFPYKDDLSEAFLSSKENMSYKGSVFRIPDGNIYRGVYVRTDWLKEAGIDIESLRNWTWDDYFMVVQKLTNKEKGRYGAAFRGGPGGVDGFTEYAYSELEALSMYPNQAKGDSKSIMDDPRAPQLWENWMSIYTKGYSPKDSINWGFKEMVNGFSSGQSGTLIQTPEVIKTLNETMDKNTWTVLPFPVKKDAKIHAFNWGPTASYSISANAKNPDLAWSLIEFISSPENNLEYSKAFNVFPNSKSALSNKYFQEGALKGYSDTLLDPKIKYTFGQFALTEWGGFSSETMKVQMQNYLSGKSTTQASVKVMQDWFAEQYKKEKK
jgi:multiple sugar transport system substrate-binding protein